MYVTLLKVVNAPKRKASEENLRCFVYALHLHYTRQISLRKKSMESDASSQ